MDSPSKDYKSTSTIQLLSTAREADSSKRGFDIWGRSYCRLPDRVLQQIFVELCKPIPIEKKDYDHLYRFFQSHRISEPDPRHLFNLLRTCRTLYSSANAAWGEVPLINQFFISIRQGVRAGSRTYIDAPNLTVFSRDLTHQIRHETQFTARYPSSQQQQLRHRSGGWQEEESAFKDLIHRRCIKWVQTFCRWPPSIIGITPAAAHEQHHDDSFAELLLDFDKRFVGVVNFHHYDDNAREHLMTTSAGGSTRAADLSGFGGFAFWAVICYCTPKEFLVLHSAGNSVWDQSSECPRIAITTRN